MLKTKCIVDVSATAAVATTVNGANKCRHYNAASEWASDSKSRGDPSSRAELADGGRPTFDRAVYVAGALHKIFRQWNVRDLMDCGGEAAYV